MALKDIAKLNDTELLNFSGSSVTAGGVLTGIAIIVVAVILSRIVSRALRRLRERSPQKSTGALYLLEKLSSYGLIFLGIISGRPPARRTTPRRTCSAQARINRMAPASLRWMTLFAGMAKLCSIS